MLWKNEYKMGVEILDNQHQALYEGINDLINTIINSTDEKARIECIDFIRYLKHYCDQHFTLEEKYQLATHYVSYDAHKKLHDTFRYTLLQYEKDFQRKTADRNLVKDFIGMLVTWLVYHVQGYDKMITSKEAIPEFSNKIELTQSIITAIKTTFNHLFLADVTLTSETLYSTRLHGEIFASVYFQGSVNSYVVFSFSTDMVYRLVCYMANLENLDNEKEILLSSVKILIGTISSHICTLLTSNVKFCSTSTPVVTLDTFDSTITNFSTCKTLLFTSSVGNFEVLIKETPIA